MQATDLLRSYLQAIRRLSGIDAVSVFVPSPTSRRHSFLLHEGDGAPIPELADLDVAHRTAEGAEDDRELPRSHARLAPSDDQECLLVRLPALEMLQLAGGGTPQNRGRRSTDTSPEASPHLFIGLRFSTGAPPISLQAGTLPLVPHETAKPTETDGWLWLLALGGALAWHFRQVDEILCDPITGLPGRYELHGRLAHAFEKAKRSGTPLSLILVNPDGFATVNERFGRQAGDRVIKAVSERLEATLRADDLIAKYGGAIFACVLHGTGAEGASTVAEKVQRSLAGVSYLDGTLGLGFSAGVATYAPPADELDQDTELMCRADQALNWAKRAGGGRCATWQPAVEEEADNRPNELSGVFTGNMVKDYRNMTLLSETMAALAAASDFDQLAARVVERMSLLLRAERVALFHWPTGGRPELLRGFTKGGGDAGTAAALVFPDELRWLVQEVRNTEKPLVHDSTVDETGNRRFAYGVPMVVEERCVGCIYLDGRADTLGFDASDHALLRGIATQLGVALDRARLAARDRARRRLEQERLTTEVADLRTALQRAKLEYRSQQLEGVLSTARRVAPTEVPVLITGESGTGKELIARAVHEASSRRSKSLVVFDCGAVPAAFVDGELFGNGTAGFDGSTPTGRNGLLQEAHLGTLLLEEICDLPLEVQAKVLRIVEEGRPASGGARTASALDVRILATTKRDLLAEVKAARFREDLYYHLSGVRLHVPPLRERPDDVLHLANHFLQTYAALYRKSAQRLTAGAEAALLQHRWPGNVRELQHQIQQAVILCEGTELDVDRLGLASATRQGGTEGQSASEELRDASADALWQRLQERLAHQIEIATSSNGVLVPLGRWLADDLILEADLAARGVASRAAAHLGIPETTFRRRRSKAVADVEAGLAPRPGSWREVREILADVVRCEELRGDDLLQRCQGLLLSLVLEQVPGDVRSGASLLGVTAPTFRRRSASALHPDC